MTSRDPFFSEFDRLARRAFGWDVGSSQGVLPMDVLRRSDDVVLDFDLPGVDADSIEVTVDHDVLTVSAVRSATELGESERYFVNERPIGRFSRQVRLSDRLDTDAVSADYNDGVLTVVIPFAEQAKPRRIAIRSGKKGKALSS